MTHGSTLGPTGNPLIIACNSTHTTSHPESQRQSLRYQRASVFRCVFSFSFLFPPLDQWIFSGTVLYDRSSRYVILSPPEALVFCTPHAHSVISVVRRGRASSGPIHGKEDKTRVEESADPGLDISSLTMRIQLIFRCSKGTQPNFLFLFLNVTGVCSSLQSAGNLLVQS